jgi:DMSO/TMAO reductase YedYZ molybdopterin-dependent catalytic subunit
MKTLEEKIVDTKTIRRWSWIAFTLFFVFVALAIAGWQWLVSQPEEDGARKPLRSMLYMNEKVFSTIISDDHRSKSFPVTAADKRVRVNGDAGMSDNFDTAAWKLQVVRAPGDTLFLTLADIKALPKTEVVFDFKCIEGWSQVTYWSGVKFSDFVEQYNLKEQRQLKYVGLNTPDKEYYVGIDSKSMMHPQTILCYEMNAKELPMNQGYPLRLIIPVKYGIKHLKRIGTLFFSDSRPPDYWFERGYDYFAGL